MIELLLLFSLAEDLAEKVSTCAKIADSLQRLTCFDVIAKEIPAPPGAAPAPSGGVAPEEKGWKVKAAKNPLDDKMVVAAFLESDESNARLMVRCRAGQTEVGVGYKIFLGAGAKTVTLRLDSETARSETWTSSTDQKMLFAPKPFAFAERLGASRTLVTQATPYRANPIVSTFILEGSAEVLKQIRGECPKK